MKVTRLAIHPIGLSGKRSFFRSDDQPSAETIDPLACYIKNFYNPNRRHSALSFVNVIDLKEGTQCINVFSKLSEIHLTLESTSQIECSLNIKLN